MILFILTLFYIHSLFELIEEKPLPEGAFTDEMKLLITEARQMSEHMSEQAAKDAVTGVSPCECECVQVCVLCVFLFLYLYELPKC